MSRKSNEARLTDVVQPPLRACDATVTPSSMSLPAEENIISENDASISAPNPDKNATDSEPKEHLDHFLDQHDRLYTSRERLLLEREEYRASFKRLQKARLSTNNAEAELLLAFREYLDTCDTTELPRTISEAFEKLQGCRDELDPLESALARTQDILAASEWEFMDQEDNFYQIDLKELLFGEHGEQAEDARQIASVLPLPISPPQPTSSPLQLNRHLLPPPPPPPLVVDQSNPPVPVSLHRPPAPPPPLPPPPPPTAPPSSFWEPPQINPRRAGSERLARSSHPPPPLPPTMPPPPPPPPPPPLSPAPSSTNSLQSWIQNYRRIDRQLSGLISQVAILRQQQAELLDRLEDGSSRLRVTEYWDSEYDGM